LESELHNSQDALSECRRELKLQEDKLQLLIGYCDKNMPDHKLQLVALAKDKLDLETELEKQRQKVNSMKSYMTDYKAKGDAKMTSLSQQVTKSDQQWHSVVAILQRYRQAISDIGPELRSLFQTIVGSGLTNTTIVSKSAPPAAATTTPIVLPQSSGTNAPTAAGVARRNATVTVNAPASSR